MQTVGSILNGASRMEGAETCTSVTTSTAVVCAGDVNFKTPEIFILDTHL